MAFKTIFNKRFHIRRNPIIYHYCNDFVLKSICQNQKLWLSNIYNMNDGSEFEWGRNKFIEVLKSNKHEFDQKFRFYAVGMVMSAIPNILPLIGCFSKNGDLLSQWRAYANDGKGFSIGFSSKAIYEGLGVNMNSVLYEEKEQSNIILNTLRGLHVVWALSGENFEEIDEPTKIFASDLAYLKNPTFFEEQEDRIIRLLVSNVDEFIDKGVHSKINDISPLTVSKRSEKDISYVQLPISIRESHIIKQVNIGPKNSITIPEVEKLFSSWKLDNVIVKNHYQRIDNKCYKKSKLLFNSTSAKDMIAWSILPL